MKIALKIYGMDCVACSNQVRVILKRIKGLNDVKVNFASSYIEIDSKDYPDLKLIERKLKIYGYSIPKEKVTINIDINLFKNVEENLIKDIKSLSNYEIKNNKLILELYPLEIKEKEIINIFKNYNLDVNIEKWENGNEEIIVKNQVKLLTLLIISTFLTIPLLWNPSPYLQFVLATLILLIPGSVFFKGAIKSRIGNLNMDVLIVLSSILVYSYSTYLAFTQKEDIKLYFLCEGVLISLVLFGRYLEILARGETERSLKGFINLIPKVARIIKNSEEKEVDIDEINIKDIVLVKSAERIPVDGKIIKGKGEVDESLLTGESNLVNKNINDFVTGGTLLRKGNIYVEVTRIGKETSLEQMIKIVKETQISVSPIKNLADRIVNYFVPTVIFISIFVFLIWFFVIDQNNLEKAIIASAGVLVVSCPCALGLAIPTSIMVGSGRSMELGILFKNASAIEKINKIKIICFDKTGTLTYGGESSNRNLLRDGISNTIEELKKKYEVIMISGDKKEIAEEVARKAGINHVFSEVKSEGKVEIIENLKKNGKVLMIGDGLNDAPAMAKSDLSISIQNGTELAKDTADIIIIGDDISKVSIAFKVSSKIMINIYQNLAWATLYNLICIPLASSGLINPSIASAAMSFSSIAVLMNALRLKNMKVKNHE